MLFGQAFSNELIVLVVLAFFTVRAILIIVAFGEDFLAIFVVSIEYSQRGNQAEHMLLVSFYLNHLVVAEVKCLKLC